MATAPKVAKVTTPKAGTAVARAKINLPIDVNAQMAAEAAEIQKRISAPSGDRVSVTQAKTFRLANGMEVDEFEGIVVEFVAANYYYENPYDRDTIEPPKCFSISLEPAGMVPSANSPDVQAGACSSCWANQFKSAGKGKACQNARLLGILPLDADADTPISILKVSPTALKAFDAHVASVARKYGMPIRAVTTKFFMSDEEYASVRFADMGLAPKDLVLLANERKAEATTRLTVEPDVSASVSDEKVGNKKPAARKIAGKR